MPTRRVYLETSVISYLTANPSRDLVLAGHQQVTRDWWLRRSRFDLFVSDAVLAEVSRGDSQAASRRLEAIAGVPLLDASDDARTLAEALLDAAALPRRAAIDAAHVAIATTNGVDFLLTWNCTHIANAAIRAKLEDVCRRAGYVPPIICTPLELLDEEQS